MQSSINSLLSTKSLAEQVAGYIEPGYVLFLEGEVGSGKSTFVKFLLNKLGLVYQGSPTFTLLNVYEAENGLKIVHSDLYRLDSSLLDQLSIYPDSAFLIEWSNVDGELRNFFPEASTIKFSYDGTLRSAVWEKFNK
jgi:tRNA threonylcarbamoyladenosine biosynthesis protein TsaE